MLSALMWWLLLLAVGLGFFPLTSYLFGKSGDGGWLFSKAVGLLVSAWALWALTVAGVTPFRQMTALASIAVLAAANYAVPLIRRRRTGETAVPAFNPKLILLEEALFLGVMLLAVYVFGFRPEAYGTEKFMDYGFMTSMARSTKLPFEDIWLSGKTVNYDYGGQYLAAFLMKASGVGAGVSVAAGAADGCDGSSLLAGVPQPARSIAARISRAAALCIVLLIVLTAPDTEGSVCRAR